MADLRLVSGDVHRLLKDVSRVRAAAGAEPAVVSLLSSLVRLVPCDLVFWHWFRLRPRFVTLAHVNGPECQAFEPPFQPWLAHLPEHPVMWPTTPTVRRLSDELSEEQFRRTWLYQEVFRVDGLRYEIGVHLTKHADQRNVVVMSRTVGDFSERDRQVLQLLQPHLVEALGTLADPTQRLTPRQSQVLRLLAGGLSDGQIARRLGISESTVGKHLERVYEQTGVHTRVEASRLAPALVSS